MYDKVHQKTKKTSLKTETQITFSEKNQVGTLIQTFVIDCQTQGVRVPNEI